MTGYGRAKWKCPACGRPFFPGKICPHVLGADDPDQITLGERSLLPGPASPNVELAEAVAA